MTEIESGTIAAFRPDPRNARKHNKKNLDMIEASLSEVGVGRSVVATKDGTIIAGNATIESAGQIGLEDAIIVRSRGDKVIIHVREDLEDGDKRATALALYDNRTGELAEWDTETLIDIQEEFGNDPSFEHIFSDRDFDKIMFGPNSDQNEPDSSSQLGTLFEYRVIVECDNEVDQAELIEQLESQGRSVKALIS